MKRNFQKGVTLVEIAIVLVIIGLLLGGILKGQELINNAKVRSIADRQNSLKAAWFSFVDRYQALPGDYVAAEQNVPGAGAVIPIGNDGAGDGTIVEGESATALQHLTGAGYLRCPQCTYNGQVLVAPVATNSLQNQYGGVMAIFVDGAQVAGGGGLPCTSGTNCDTYIPDAGAIRRPRLGVHTGPNIPSNIMAEVDRKLDDGAPHAGDFRASNYAATGLAPAVDCIDTGANVTQQTNTGNYNASIATTQWRHASVPPEQNCGGFIFI